MGTLISIVDDDSAIRDSVGMLLESAGYAVKSFASAKSFLENGDLGCGCIISDVRMPDMSGPELQDELNRRDANSPLIMITGHGDVSLAVLAMRAGALDFIEKPFDDQRMLDSVARAVEIGKMTRDRGKDAMRAREFLARLTHREREIFDKLAMGHANKNVARELGISPRTVEIHRAHIMTKLSARSLSDIVRISLSAA